MKMAKGFLLYMMIHCPFFIHVNGRVIVLTTKLLLKSTFVNSHGFFLFFKRLKVATKNLLEKTILS